MFPDQATFAPNAHQSGASDYSAPLWTLMMFEAFLRQVVDGGAGPAISVPQVATA